MNAIHAREQIAYGVRPLPGHTVRFRSYEGRSRRGVIRDMATCAWSGNITYFIETVTGGRYSVQAASVDGVVR